MHCDEQIQKQKNDGHLHSTEHRSAIRSHVWKVTTNCAPGENFHGIIQSSNIYSRAAEPSRTRSETQHSVICRVRISRIVLPELHQNIIFRSKMKKYLGREHHQRRVLPTIPLIPIEADPEQRLLSFSQIMRLLRISHVTDIKSCYFRLSRSAILQTERERWKRGELKIRHPLPAPLIRRLYTLLDRPLGLSLVPGFFPGPLLALKRRQKLFKAIICSTLLTFKGRGTVTKMSDKTGHRHIS